MVGNTFNPTATPIESRCWNGR